MLDGSPYLGYLYAYPHKTAYRPLRPRPSLRTVWRDEPRDALFLYVHVPFCEMRCGFCNLFTTANPQQSLVTEYLRQLGRQADAVGEALGPARFALGAIGGGTPTYLNPEELAQLFDVFDRLAPDRPPLSVETSPATATPDRLAVLAEHGTRRVSIGVQSFLDREAHAAGRPQKRSDVDRALATIRASAVPELNIDLIYGIAGQTPATWAQSLQAALAWQPEEVYLYPLYVRPLTGLVRRANSTVDQRLDLYRQARDTLLEAGYFQLSMRHFRRLATPESGYDCQDDGMVGLGCGARSYTEGLHYSFDYAVSVRGVRAVLADYLTRDDFSHAEVGFVLDEAERRRRWLLKSLLRTDGVDRASFERRFGVDVLDAFAPLAELADRGWLTSDPATVRLTAAGLERSDAIGPWLVSGPVWAAMGEYALR
jgi:coproporphyrinogen III oxidase-like Fe-S oxidoreductase